MRYFLVGVAVLFTTCAWAEDYNEFISAISFNPSRTGAYTYLKIVNKATLTGLDMCQYNQDQDQCSITPVAGGISLPAVNIRSKEAGTIKVVVNECSECSIKIKTINPSPSSSSTKLETVPGSFVAKSGNPPDSWSAEGWGEAIKGINVDVKKGATLTSTLGTGSTVGGGKTFVEKLKVSDSAAVTFTVPDKEGTTPGVNLNEGGVVSVTNSIKLGGVKIESFSNGSFEWKPLAGLGYEVLGVN